MPKLYLVTGFLGAGKTTFLRHFIKEFQDKKVALVINEFGKVGIDGSLLSSLECEMTEINNGSIFCQCKVEQFESSIHNIIEKNTFDIILIEASGLSDPSEVGNIFTNSWYPEIEYGGTICIVDALRFHKVYASTHVCRMQLATSDLVFINKTDIATKEQIDSIIEIAKAQKEYRNVYLTVNGVFTKDMIETINLPKQDEKETMFHTKDITLQKLSLNVSNFSKEGLVSFIKMFADDTYRVKGFVTIDDINYLVDCVGPIVSIEE
ncbi:MAG: GTP-binding protein, partial [Clostridia bacterium]|nr:GTP-binding protein [Clostridia bacterium]